MGSYNGRKNFMKSPNKGFTLIETLLVVGILGVVLVSGSVSFVGFQRKTILKTTAEEIASGIEQVRSDAIAAKYNLEHGIHFETDSYTIFSGSVFGISDPDNSLYELAKGVTITEVNLGFEGDLVFSKVSGSPNSSGFIEITYGTDTASINVNDEGVVNIVLDQTVELPSEFNLITPVSGTLEETTLTPFFDWEDSAGTGITYELWHSTDSTFATRTIVSAGSVSETTPSISKSLTDNSRNYWKVRAVNSQGFSTWSNQLNWYIDTQVSDGPTSFNLLSPVDMEIVVTYEPFFDWEDSTDPDGGSVTYDLIVDDDSDFSTPYIHKTDLTISEYTAVPGDSFVEDTYYWKVIARDDEGSTIPSTQQSWSFVITLQAPPGYFNLLFPTNGVTLTSTEFTFDWEDSIDLNPSDNVTYEIILDDNSDFSSPNVQHSGLTTSEYSLQPTDLVSNNTTYYWKVIATDGTYNVDSNQTNWSFSIDADLYVDQSVSTSGNGYSWASAFKTIAEAIAVMAGGDTVHIANGNYTDDIDLTSIQSGTSGEYTKFIAKPGDTNVLVSGNGDNETIYFDGTDYFRLENLKITGSSRYGIYLRNDATNIILENIEAYGNGRDGVYGASAVTSNISINGGSYHDNGQEGIQIQGSNINISNTEVYSNSGLGIDFQYVVGGEISNSIIYSNGSYGLRLNYGESLSIQNNQIHSQASSNGIYSYRTKSLEFSENTVRDNGGDGVYLRDLDYSLGGGVSSAIHHNVAYGNSDGFYLQSLDGGYIYNNTSDSNNDSGFYINGTSGVIILRNNIMTSNTYGFYVRSGSSNIQHDYADIWGNGSNYRSQGATYAGANTIAADPMFVNSSTHDYHLTSGSACIDSGDPSGTYNDPDGTRSDIGRYYYPQ